MQIDLAVSSHEWQLTENGRFTSRTLATKIKPYQPSRIFTSHEAKAQVTGQVIAEQLSIPCATAVGLQEHNRQGVPYFANKLEFRTAVANFFTHPNELVFGQETAVEAGNRFTQAVNRQIETHPQSNIAIVTHGTVLTLFICQHNPNLNPIQFWQSLTLPCAFVLTLPSKQLTQSLYIRG
ncbi:MAG: histidine phosphatase family protein [Chloroflexi bacterium]|nr:histidine phosphatase family protein [Chloroflexota bacterium]